MTVKTENQTELTDQDCLKGIAARAYAKEQKKPDQEKLITDSLDMVKRIVNKVTTYIKPPLSKEDLVSAGTIGLVKAARDFDPTKNADFKTYAYIRVKGAVIDELRSWTFAPASLAKQIRQAEEILKESIEKTGAAPADEKIAEKMDISVDKLYRIYENARSRHFLSINGLDDDEPALGNVLVAKDCKRPEDILLKQELIKRLAQEIQNLPQKEKQIIILYYQQELTMKEISLVLKITESRVSQLHAGAVFKLANQLKEYDDVG